MIATPVQTHFELGMARCARQARVDGEARSPPPANSRALLTKPTGAAWR